MVTNALTAHTHAHTHTHTRTHTHTHNVMQNKTVYEIASDLNRLHHLGVSGQLTPADVRGGTFSLSNIGAVSYCN